MSAAPSTMGMPTSRAPARGDGPSQVRAWTEARRSGAAAPKAGSRPGEEIVKRRHPDWTTNEIHWRWLLDSFEGGERYRNAEYGPDRRNMPVRNLFRHKREYPDVQQFAAQQQGLGSYGGAAMGVATQGLIGRYPGMLGSDPGATAADDDYELRRARTPPPEFLAEAIEIHLGKIYEQAISREGPDTLQEWWEDVNGGGVSVDEWIREHVAPLLLAMGSLDVCFDRPSVPSGVDILTEADEDEWGLKRYVASYILPQNMVWWVNDPASNYLECLVREYWAPTLATPDRMGGGDDPDGGAQWEPSFPGEVQAPCQRFRHWTSTEVTLYSEDGTVIEETREHGYKFVPIVRLVDQVRHRTPMIGKPRYEVLAEYQREYYNRDSELILNDILQAHPFLSGAEDFCKSEQSLSTGPGYVLPMKKLPEGKGYQGWEFVSPSKDPAESIRANMAVLVDNKDRRVALTKPAGVKGTTGGTVSLSGFSKSIDAAAGNQMMTSLAKTLARVERQCAEFHQSCIMRRRLKPAERKAIRISYPSRFQLKTAEALLGELAMLVQVLAIEQMPPGDAVDAHPAQPDGSTNKSMGAKPLPIVRDLVPDDQAGGNPSHADALSLANKRFAVPTMIAEYLRMIAHASLQGNDPTLFKTIDKELEVFFVLHILPGLGIASDREADDGHGSEEQIAAEDRTGQSAATDVTGNVSMVA